MYNVNEQAVPTSYPLALSGMGSINPASRVSADWNVLQRDYPHLVTPQDRQEMFAAFDDNNTVAAAAVVARIQAKLKGAVRPPKAPSFLEKLGPNDELLTGVKNLYIYGGIALLVLAKYFKKRS